MGTSHDSTIKIDRKAHANIAFLMFLSLFISPIILFTDLIDIVTRAMVVEYHWGLMIGTLLSLILLTIATSSALQCISNRKLTYRTEKSWYGNLYHLFFILVSKIVFRFCASNKFVNVSEINCDENQARGF